MASVQQLEKLYELQRIFEGRDTLEAMVAAERVSLLVTKVEKTLHQRAFLREERRRLRTAAEHIDERKRALKIMGRCDWLPQGLLSDVDDRKILFNIGGLIFEIPSSVLNRDKSSLLSQLTSNDPPISPDQEGIFYFDRDWWLFRYIAIFLRDGTLPDDRHILAQLYKESTYWNLCELQTAIEEDKLHLRKDISSINKDAWWRKIPTWWQAIDEATKKAAADAKIASNKSEDWWKDTSYKGKNFLPISTADDKVVTKSGEKDAKDTLRTTFSR